MGRHSKGNGASGAGIASDKNMDYVNVAFPLSVNQVFTYGVPSQLDTVLQPGVRVLAPFRSTHEEGVVR